MKSFWKTKTLEQMTVDEWESLCDGCGLCCLVKIEDEDSGEVLNTSVCCQLLDIDSCRCRNYKQRFEKAPMCTKLSRDNIAAMNWLPESCAYKRLANNKKLPQWHYLNTGNKNSVHEAGVSAKWFAQSEQYIHPQQLYDFVIHKENKR